MFSKHMRDNWKRRRNTETIHYVSERDHDLRHNIVLFISKTFHLQRKNEIKKKKKRKTENEREKETSCLVAVKNGMRNCNLGVRLGVRKTSSIYVLALQFPVPLSPPYSPYTHKHTHAHTYAQIASFFLPQFKCLWKKKKNQSKTTERKVAESAKIQEGVERAGAERIWRTNWAIRENYEDVHGSGNIILYFKKTTILWYSVTGASGGRRTVIHQNETDILSQCRLMTWKSCPYCVRELESIGLWNVRTHAHLWT